MLNPIYYTICTINHRNSILSIKTLLALLMAFSASINFCFFYVVQSIIQSAGTIDLMLSIAAGPP
jgi:hypothetical protein